MFDSFFKGKKVLITGHTGFKGSWLSLWLKMNGAQVCGYSLNPPTEPAMFDILGLNDILDKSVIGDILDEVHLDAVFEDFAPEIVIHMAAQPLVRYSYSEPKLTYKTNVIGTLNVLEAARKCGTVKAFVNITTDKCYENKETTVGYKEDDPMGGYDMYSSSKGCAELLSSSYRRSFLSNGGYNLATVRAGNVIGGGDWALDRLIPDCVRAIVANKDIEIRNPSSVRPWQHVLEPLSGYMLVARKLYGENGKTYAEGFNFGPKAESVLTVETVTNAFIAAYGSGRIVVGPRSKLHEAKLLTLNIDKAEKVLGWIPSYSAQKAVELSAQWYKSYYNNEDMLEFTKKQIRDFEGAIKWKKI